MKVVKVRINVSGSRVIGYIELPADVNRVSDMLNDPTPYIFVASDEDALHDTGCKAIRKDAVTYLEALEEPGKEIDLKQKGDFLQVGIKLQDPYAALTGELFVPHGSSSREVVNRERKFLILRNAALLDSVEQYRFLALGEHHILMIEYMTESEQQL